MLTLATVDKACECERVTLHRWLSEPSDVQTEGIQIRGCLLVAKPGGLRGCSIQVMLCSPKSANYWHFCSVLVRMPIVAWAGPTLNLTVTQYPSSAQDHTSLLQLVEVCCSHTALLVVKLRVKSPEIKLPFVKDLMDLTNREPQRTAFLFFFNTYIFIY